MIKGLIAKLDKSVPKVRHFVQAFFGAARFWGF
jgi:hypothetical protein